MATSETEITFTTAARAPRCFDAWAFYWTAPASPESVETEIVVRKPGGQEYYGQKLNQLPAGEDVESDFRPGFAGGDPSVFYDQHIVVSLRFPQDQMTFPADIMFRPPYFAFFQHDDEGKVKWQFPFEATGAVVEPAAEGASPVEPATPFVPVKSERVIENGDGLPVRAQCEITYRTAEPAPEHFDAWRFMRTTPVAEEAAQTAYVVWRPDGKEHFRRGFHDAQPGAGAESCFVREGPAGDPEIFFGEHVAITLYANTTRMVSPRHASFRPPYFSFRRGGSNWRLPSRAIAAVPDGNR